MRRGRAWARVCGSVLALMLGLSTSAAIAQPADKQGALSEEEAAQLFERGLAAFDRGESAEAVKLWEQLFERGDPARSWRVLYNLGLAYEAAGDRPRAVERYEAFYRKVGELPGSLPIEFEARRQDAVERATKLRPNLGLLRIAPAKDGERVLVRVGDQPAREAGFAMYLEPGHFTIVMGVEARAVQIEVELQAGELETVVAHQRPPPPPPPPPPYEAPIHVGVLIAGASLSVISVGIPVGLYFRASSLREEAAALATFDPGYPAAVEAYEEATALYQGMWAIPAAFAATTLALLVVDVVASSSRPRVRASASLAGLSLELRLP